MLEAALRVQLRNEPDQYEIEIEHQLGCRRGAGPHGGRTRIALGLGGASAKSGREGRQEGQLRAAGKPVLAIREAQRPIGNRC
jgi:hypothetical protein